MNVLAQQVWKETRAIGVLAVILGGMALAGPGPSILVALSLFGVCLLALI
jgi:uncharacterized membrane protein HdeD (DUF308 family)